MIGDKICSGSGVILMTFEVIHPLKMNIARILPSNQACF